MISPQILTVLMWSVMTVWSVTAAAVLIEFHVRSRRSARASALHAQFTSEGVTATDAAGLTRAQFQELIQAGLPAGVETSLGRQLRMWEGDAELFALATGSSRATTEEQIYALQVLVSGRHAGMHLALAAALRGPNWDTAAVALRLMRRLDDEPSVRVLVAALAAGDYAPSRIAATLDRMSPARGPYLAPLLDHPSDTVRFWTLLLFGRIDASPWAARIRGLLNDRAPMVRRAAVETLGRTGTIDDWRLVTARFRDPAAMVRVHAARAAAVFPEPGVADALATLLGDREWVVRAAARESLQILGDVAQPAVLRALWLGDPFAVNSAAEVLFVTGATVAMVERLLEQPTDVEQIRLVERVMAASGPQIARAVHDQLEPGEALDLKRLIGGEAPATIRRTRKR